MDDLREVLGNGLSSLGVEASAAQLDRLIQYLGLLEKWGRTYNLTAIRDARSAVDLHLLDSLLVLPHLEGVRHVLDVGTGAGLPGIPLAILMPETRFVLLDSSGKKIRFVRQAILELGLVNVEAQALRIQDFSPSSVRFDAILARAFSSLGEIRALTSRLLGEGGWIFALKGRYPEDELKSLGADCVEVIPLTLPGVPVDRHLVRYR